MIQPSWVYCTKTVTYFYHSEIKTFEQWCDASKLILNVKKTEEIVFDPREVGVHSPVVIYNTQIKQVCSNKYLGIYIDNMFTWQIHVDNLCAKLQQRLYFLRRLRLYGVNKKIRTVFYQAVLESLIRYGIQAWYGNLSVQLKNKLSHIVRMAMKIVDLKDYPSLKTLFEQSVHRGAHKILADPSHIYSLSMCFCLQEEGIGRFNRFKNSFVPASIRILNGKDKGQ